MSTPFDPQDLSFNPPGPIWLDVDFLREALRSARRGAAADLSGTRYEHLRVLLEDETLWGDFCSLACAFARADIPTDVVDVVAIGRMTALAKPDGGVRGIGTGCAFRRLVCKAFARQFADVFADETAPFQFALQTKAGADALAHTLRYLADANENTVIVSMDGIGAFDHAKRSEFLRKLRVRPRLQQLLPLVRTFYARASTYLWTDAVGHIHTIFQGEGGEQGDALMPALYALGQHDALEEASANLQEGEQVFVFWMICIFPQLPKEWRQPPTL